VPYFRGTPGNSRAAALLALASRESLRLHMAAHRATPPVLARAAAMALPGWQVHQEQILNS
jgi:hypothetical protein